MNEFRPLIIGDIDYLYLTARPNRSSLLPPQEFSSFFWQIIKYLPKNLIQLEDPASYFTGSKYHQTKTPIRLSILYLDSLDQYLRFDPVKQTLKVVLISEDNRDNCDELVAKFKFNYPLVFFLPLFDDSGFKWDGIVIRTVGDLLKKIKENKEKILEVLRTVEATISFYGDYKLLKDQSANPSHRFQATHGNSATQNQILGNYWVGSEIESSEVSAIKESMAAAESEETDPSRFNLISQQVEEMNRLHFLSVNYLKIRFPNPCDYILPPLILVNSYNYPHLMSMVDTDDVESKIILKAAGYGQRINYTNYLTEKEIPEESGDPTNNTILKGVASLLRTKNDYLDGITYLHSSFWYSPIIRFPFLGDDLKKDLSFFRPEAMNRNPKTLKMLIHRFGKKLIKRIMPQDKVDAVFKQPRQIVSISDLPTEWICHNDVPLSFTHDLTRLPEYPLGGLTSFYVYNSTSTVKIRETILSETLLLFCVAKSDPNYDMFYRMYKLTVEHTEKFGLKAFECESIDEAAYLVKKYSPTLLVFDCHGNFEKDDLSSYLLINNEILDGRKIVEKKISAPIIFLSACYTNPTYGYTNGIAGAFFEAGSLSVTATYFPISITEGSILYLRILTNLQQACTIALHSNWLSFICHQIRTSYTSSFLVKAREAARDWQLSGDELKRFDEDISNLVSGTNTGLMFFAERELVLERFLVKLNELFEKFTPGFSVSADSVPSEYLYYTNLGRGDLIEFESWRKAYYKLNQLEL